MEFSQKKLSEEALQYLQQCQIQSFRPFEPLPAPAYVYLKENKKLIAVKGPLDFFVPEELDRLSRFEYLYFSEHLSAIQPFQTAGQRVRELLNWRIRVSEKLAKGKSILSIMPPPFELSDAILRVIAPLWWCRADKGTASGVEPCLLVSFTNEVCNPILPQLLLEARDQDTMLYDTALLRSSLAVFLALHVGYCHLELLNQLRARVFSATMAEESASVLINEVDEFTHAIHTMMESSSLKIFNKELLKISDEKIYQKLTDRIARIETKLGAREVTHV